MTTYPNLSLILPTRGATGSGHWADVLDANTAKIDAHDHTSGKGLRIKSAALSIDGDVSFGSTWAITALNRVSLSAVAAPIVNRSLFCKSADGELYWLSATGTQVKMTSGSSLNVAAFTGGIGGDYTAVAAALNYDDSAKRYTHKGAAGTNWARLQSGPVRIAELDTAETVFVEQAAPAALAASYTMTWPTALPGSTLLAQIDATGQWIFSNTVPNATTFSAAASFSSTVGVTGLITATAGLTAAVNQSLTVSGTGTLKHGTQTLSLHASNFVAIQPTTPDAGAMQLSFNGSFNARGDLGGDVSSDPIQVIGPIPLIIGKRILAVRAYIADNATGPTTVTLTVRSESSIGATAVIGSAATSSGSGANQTLTVSGLTATVSSGLSYLMTVTSSSTTSGRGTFLFMVEIDYDHP